MSVSVNFVICLIYVSTVTASIWVLGLQDFQVIELHRNFYWDTNVKSLTQRPCCTVWSFQLYEQSKQVVSKNSINQ